MAKQGLVAGISLLATQLIKNEEMSTKNEIVFDLVDLDRRASGNVRE